MADTQNTFDMPGEVVTVPADDYGWKPTQNERELLVRDSVSPYFNRPELLLQKLQESEEKPVENMVTEGSQEYRNKMRSLDAHVLSTAVDYAPEQAMAIADGIRTQELQELQESDQYLNFKNNILAAPGSENLSPAEVEDLAAGQMTLHGMAKMMDEQSMWGKATDFVGMMFVPDIAWNTSDVVKEALQHYPIEGATGKYMDSMSDMISLRNYIIGLNEKDRLRVLNHLSKIYDEVDDNQLQKAEFFNNLLGLNEYVDLEDVADKAGLATLLLQFGPGIVERTFRGANLIRKMGKLGDYGSAMRGADIANESVDGARVIGVSQVDSASAGNPFSIRELLAGAPEGVSTNYRHHAQKIDDVLAQLEDVAQIDVAAHTPEEQARIAAALRKNLPEDQQIDDVVVVFEDGQPIVKYNLLDEAGNVLERASRPYILDDVGKFVDPNPGFIANALRGIWSPKYIQGLDAKQIVDKALVGTLAKAKLSATYTKAAEMAFKPIKRNKQSIAKVDKMLQMLDGKDIAPSYQQLVREGVGGVTLSDKEYKAYMGIRRILDDMHRRNDLVLRQEMELKGARAVHTDDGAKVFAKPYEDSEAAEAAYHADTESITIFKDGNAFEDVSKSSLEQAYKDGYVLVRSHSTDFHDWFKVGIGADAEHFRFALVKREAMGDIPANVLNKVPNYLPKFNKDANWFVKEVRQVKVGGRTVPREIALGYAPTKAAAERGLSGQRAVDAEAGLERTLVVTRDSMQQSIDSGDVIKASGGLIRGKRSKQGLAFYGDFGGGRADTLESMQRAISMTSDRMAMSRWRMAVTEEWYNSAKMHIPNLSTDWAQAREAVARMPVGNLRTKLLNAHDQISGMRMLPTKGEQAFKGHILAAAEHLDGLGSLKAERAAAFLYRVRDKNPVELLKSSTFNLTLGAFSMVQIPVQAAGAMVAFAANPVYAMKAFDKWLIASTLDIGTDLRVVKETAGILGKKMGMTDDALKNLQSDYEFWRASGLRESVVRGNADATSVMNGLPLDAGLMRRGFTKLLEAGQTPYRIGELTNMRISFFTALEREKDIMGSAFTYTDDVLKRVLARTENTRLNMNAANKAAYQKGFLSLPTQFKQIYTKYIEALVGREFTPVEKLRIFSAQALAFGAAGVPIVNHFSAEMARMMGIAPTAGGEGEGIEMDADQMRMYQEGMVGYFLNGKLGIDAAFSGRITVSADIIEELKRMAVDGRTPVLETFLGASAAPGKNAMNFLNQLYMAGNMVYDAEELNEAELYAAAEIAAKGLARMSASGRNFLAAKDIDEGWVRNSKGQILYEIEPDKLDALFRAVGFGSIEKQHMYEQLKENLSVKEERQGRVDQFTSAWHDLIQGFNNNSPEQIKAAQMALSMINKQIDDLAMDESIRIREMVLERINNPNDKMGKVISDTLVTFYTDSTNSANLMNATMAQKMEESRTMGRQILLKENE